MLLLNPGQNRPDAFFSLTFLSQKQKEKEEMFEKQAKTGRQNTQNSHFWGQKPEGLLVKILYTFILTLQFF